MENYENRSKDYYLHQATSLFEKMMGPLPFRLIGIVDDREIHRDVNTIPTAYTARMMDSSDIPTWHEKPPGSTLFVIKLLKKYEVITGIEATALERCNRIFKPNDINRVNRLYARSDKLEVDVSEDWHGWIAQEFISPPFQSLYKYIQEKRILALEESISIATAIAEILTKLHGNGIVHRDLDGFAALEHFFWDSQAGRLRIIDLGEAKVSKIQKPFTGNESTVADQPVVGKTLLRTLTGVGIEVLLKNIENSKRLDTILEVMESRKIPKEIQEIILHTNQFLLPHGTVPLYEKNAAGTKKLFETLNELLSKS